MRTLRHYPLFKELDARERRAFIEYYLSGTNHLKAHGFKAAKIPSATSVYGGKPDNVFVARGRPPKLRVLKAALRLSDHAAVAFDIPPK